uniref:Uncharacterized protein n=1 Tax=Thermofilum pendens TaxID=2269 RepID=A0A7C1TB25_THEPE
MGRGVEVLTRRVAAAYYTLKKLLDPAAILREAFLTSLKDKVMKLEPRAGEGDLETLLDFVELHGPPLPLRQLLDKRKKLLGFVCAASPECEEIVKAMSSLASEFSGCSNVVIEDMSVDSLAAKYIIEKHSPSQVVIYALKQRGRAPGLYAREFNASARDYGEALRSLSASLRGSLDIDVLLGGLAALGVERVITVIECEPSGSREFCRELIVDHLLREVKSLCA